MDGNRELALENALCEFAACDTCRHSEQCEIEGMPFECYNLEGRKDAWEFDLERFE